MKIKNLQLYAFVMTILAVILTICLVTIISYDQAHDTYTEEVYVTDRINDLYFVTFNNGHNMGFYSDDEIEIGEKVTVTVDSNNTETIVDDEIVNVNLNRDFVIKDTSAEEVQNE